MNNTYYPLHSLSHLYWGDPEEAHVERRVAEETSDVQSQEVKVETYHTASAEVEDNLIERK